MGKVEIAFVLIVCCVVICGALYAQALNAQLSRKFDELQDEMNQREADQKGWET